MEETKTVHREEKLSLLLRHGLEQQTLQQVCFVPLPKAAQLPIFSSPTLGLTQNLTRSLGFYSAFGTPSTTQFMGLSPTVPNQN